MANDIMVQGIGQDLALTDEFIGQLQTGISEVISQTKVGTGKPFIRLLKSGEWVYGPSDEEVQDGSSWVVNLMTFGWGWCCWVDGGKGEKNTLRGEVMGSVFKTRQPQPAPIDGTAYNEQFSFELKCLDGDDEGVEVLYKTASYGGKSGVISVLDAVRKRAATERVFVFPVLELKTDSYNHTKWGKTYTPVFEIVGWANANGELEAGSAEAKPEAVPTPPPAPARQRKAPVSTQQAHAKAAPKAEAAEAAPRRRRPGR